MDKLRRAHYELLFKVKFRESTGTSFQDFFSDIMEKCHPGDFQRVRPWGSSGDRKNDGYLRSERELFQVYAPNEMSANETINKIDEDFNGALPYWKDYFDNWVFVHNSIKGLGPDVLKKLLELDKENPTINLKNWGFEELRQKLFSLSEDDIASILGLCPSYGDVQNVGYEDLKIILETIAGQPPLEFPDIEPVSKEKIEINALSDDVETLLKAGMRKEKLVERFFNQWHDPNYGDQIATTFENKYNELKSRGFLPDVIFKYLQDFALGERRGDPKIEAAGLAVLAYLFVKCDIYEKTSKEENK